MMCEKLSITDVYPVIKNYYLNTENKLRGHLHIVLEDGNIKNKHIEFCKEQAFESGDQEAVSVCDMLLNLSETQRRKICGMLDDKEKY